MAYLYETCDQISDFCHQYLMRKMRRKIYWTDGRTEVKQYTPSGERGYKYDRRYIVRDIQVTRVKYNQYTSCRLKVLAKWLKICRVMIKRVLIFLEGIACKHFLVWGLLSICFHFLKLDWKSSRV